MTFFDNAFKQFCRAANSKLFFISLLFLAFYFPALKASSEKEENNFIERVGEEDNIIDEQEPSCNCLASEFSLKKKKNYRYELAVCAIFQNEASYLKEWIEFHKLVGASHFYLFNNLSTDDYLNVLAPYIASGEVELIEWPYTSSNGHDWNAIQCNAYTKALQMALGKAKWLAFLDTDEFLFPIQENTLPAFLKNYEDCAGVCVNWQMYGTSGVHEILPGQLLIEQLVIKASTDYAENIFVKSIVRPFAVDKITDPHYVVYKEGFTQVNPDKETFDGSHAPYISIDKVRINHYWTRDEWFFYNRKCARRQKWQEGQDGQINRMNALNQIYDDSIFRFVPLLKERMGLN